MILWFSGFSDVSHTAIHSGDSNTFSHHIFTALEAATVLINYSEEIFELKSWHFKGR